MIFLSDSEVNPDTIEGNPDIKKWLIPIIKRPKLKFKKENNILTISRKNSFFGKKQIFKFNTNTELEFETLSSVFDLMFNNFINKEREINDNQHLRDFLNLFESYNMFIMPKLIKFIIQKVNANPNMYIRFLTLVSGLETLVESKTISYVKYRYLISIIKNAERFKFPSYMDINYNGNTNFDNTIEPSFIEVIDDINCVHEYLDMITLFKWSYLFYIYKFNKYGRLEK